MNTQRKGNQRAFKLLRFLKALIFAFIGLGAFAAGTLYYAKKIEPFWFDTHHIKLKLPRLTPAFKDYRLVQISDLHADSTFMTSHRLAGLVQKINTLQADLLVITGDFVTDHMLTNKQTLAELRNLRVKDGVFGVMGNHDHSSNVEWVRSCLQGTNVRELNNKTHTVYRGDEMLHIVGMDDLWPENIGIPKRLVTYLPLLQQMTDSLPEQGTAILLVHEPDFADISAQVDRYDLELSGHSHGGQVRFPFIGPVALPPLARNYPCGLYRVKNMFHYTNRGLGMVSPRVRLNCRPEIAVFELS